VAWRSTRAGCPLGEAVTAPLSKALDGMSAHSRCDEWGRRSAWSGARASHSHARSPSAKASTGRGRARRCGKKRDLAATRRSGARGLGLRSRCAALHGAAARRRVLPPRAASCWPSGFDLDDPCAHHHGARLPGPNRDRERCNCSGTTGCSRRAPGGGRRARAGQRTVWRWSTRPPMCCTSHWSPSCAAAAHWLRWWRSSPEARRGDAPAMAAESDCAMSERTVAPALAPPVGRPPARRRRLAEVAPIVDAVRTGGEAALRECAQRSATLQPGAQLFHDRAELDQALARLPTHERARSSESPSGSSCFAEAQRARPMSGDGPSARGSRELGSRPSSAPAAYAPGGRYCLLVGPHDGLTAPR